MASNTGWTPASRPGIVPLHPLSFGTILGRSFTALRQNPRVLLGFALVVQTAAYLLAIVGVGAVGIWAFLRLDTVAPGSPDYDTLAAGSALITGAAAFLLGIPAFAIVVIVQSVVVAEVSAEVVAERLPLRQVWRRVRPVVWRLLGWAALVVLVAVVAIAVFVAVLVGVGLVVAPLAVVLGLVVGLGAIPLVVWLSTKLMLVPAVIILERATLRGAIARSWHLTRRRFWVAFGVLVVISLIFGVIAQTVSVPLSLGVSFFGAVFSPTGDADVSQVIALVLGTVAVQALVLLVQSVGAIVQSTAIALVYVDCRMRHEGLDLDLQAYVERRDAGATDLPDPWRQHIGREIAPRPAAPASGYGYGYPGAAAGYPPPSGSPGGYPEQAYPPAPAPYPQQAYPPAPQPYPQQAYPPASAAPSPAGAAAPALPPYAREWAPPPSAPATTAAPAAPGAPAASDAPAPAPAPTAWTAPGTTDDDDRVPPWRG